MYSLIRSLIGLNEARMQIHERVVVRTTRMSDSPSTPTLYWIPKSGIHSSASVYWNARASGRQRVEADDQEERDDPRDEARGEGQRAGVARRRGRHEQCPDERREHDDRQDRDVADGHQRAARTRNEPAMTISPTAIPRA